MTLPGKAIAAITVRLGGVGRLTGSATVVEYTFFFLLIVGNLAIRIARLGEIPRVITGDELDNVQTAYHIIEGTGPGPFGFDWKPGPALSLYPLAWTVQLFGDQVWSFRLFPVLLSLGTLVGFYLVARGTLRPFAALAGMALLGSNLWFLHFSRTAWDNMNAALFAIGACWATSRAVSTQRWHWWVVSGSFSALGVYGYFTGRLIILAVAVQVAIAVGLRMLSLRSAARGLALTTIVAGVLLSPFARNAIENWDYFNRRTQNVSVFNTREPYEGDTDGWVIAAKNVVRNYRGFVLQEGSEFRRGLWMRYGPPGQAPLDLLSAHLFWAGLAVGLVCFRRRTRGGPMPFRFSLRRCSPEAPPISLGEFLSLPSTSCSSAYLSTSFSTGSSRGS